jgi:hypothetical protein
MKPATSNKGTDDCRLVVASRDLALAVDAAPVAVRMKQAIERRDELPPSPASGLTAPAEAGGGAGVRSGREIGRGPLGRGSDVDQRLDLAFLIRRGVCARICPSLLRSR